MSESLSYTQNSTIIIAFTVSMTTAVVLNLIYSVADDINQKKEIDDETGIELVRPDEMRTWLQYIWRNLEQFHMIIINNNNIYKYTKKQFGLIIDPDVNLVLPQYIDEDYIDTNTNENIRQDFMEIV
jgi:hypothetical protein